MRSSSTSKSSSRISPTTPWTGPDGLVETGRTGNGHETIGAIRRGRHNLKGIDGSFDDPLITLPAHRMEDYLAVRRDRPFILPTSLDPDQPSFVADLAVALAILGIA